MRMKCLPISIAILAAATSSRCVAGPQTQASAVDVTARVNQVFSRWDRHDSPGCAVGVYKGGQIVYKHGYGMANLTDDIPITPITVFHVASMSKQFTSAAIVLLAEQGKLSLDDDVHKYIPELPDFGERITLAQLIHHTSGLRDQWELLELAGWRYSLDLITDEDVMSVVTRQKQLNFKPGERYLYCNTGFTLLGLVVKRVSGMSLREFTSKNIFDPLGMRNTHFRDDHAEIVKHNALGYEQAGAAKPLRLSVTNFDTVGATSLHTTVEDLQLWDENFYHPRIGASGFIAQMLERAKLNSGEQIDYASGLVIGKYKGVQTVDHAGADAGYRSDMTRFPEQHFSAAVLCNSAEANPSALVRSVADIFLSDRLTSNASDTADHPASSDALALTSDEMSEFSGTYWNAHDDAFMNVFEKNSKLMFSGGGPESYELRPTDKTTFHIAGVPWGDAVVVHFVPSASGKPRRFERKYRDDKPVVYEAVEAFAPTPVQVSEYAGAYVSDEIDPVYRIDVDNGNLRLMRLKHEPDLLKPAVQDAFFGEIGTVRFTRDSHHGVSGFILNGDRVRDFHFTKRLN